MTQQLEKLLLASALTVIAVGCVNGGGSEPGTSLGPGEYTVSDVAKSVIHLPEQWGDELEPGQRLAIGDVDGDGSADLVVGVPGADGPGGSRPDAGAVVVVNGKDIDGEFGLDDRAQTVVYGSVAGDNLGFSVAVGDLNGDGRVDIVGSAINANGIPEVRTDMGEVYALFGGDSPAPEVDLAEGDFDMVIQPAEGFSHLGTSLAISDLDGDGVQDLVVGAPYAGRAEGSPAGSARTTTGEAYVFRGGNSLSGRLSVADGDEDIRLKGVSEFDQFGQSVAATDLDGDELPEVVVGAPGYDPAGLEDAGAVFGFRWNDGGAAAFADGAQYTVHGVEPGARLGSVVAVDPESDDDILLSAPTAGLADRPGCGVLYRAAAQEGIDSVGSLTVASMVGSTMGEHFPTALNAATTGERVIAGSAGAGGGAGALFVLAGFDGEVDLAAPPPDSIVITGDQSTRLGTALASWDPGRDGTVDVAVLSMPGPGKSTGNSGAIYLLEL